MKPKKLSEHFTEAQAFHEEKAERHENMAELHKSAADDFADQKGGELHAKYHKAAADLHSEHADAHRAYAKHLGKMAERAEGDASYGSGEKAAGSLVTQGDLVTLMAQLESRLLNRLQGGFQPEPQVKTVLIDRETGGDISADLGGIFRS